MCIRDSSRTVDESARSPKMSLSAESSAVLPAPVSPVKTVRPALGTNVASRMSAMLETDVYKRQGYNNSANGVEAVKVSFISLFPRKKTAP